MVAKVGIIGFYLTATVATRSGGHDFIAAVVSFQ